MRQDFGFLPHSGSINFPPFPTFFISHIPLDLTLPGHVAPYKSGVLGREGELKEG